VAVLGGFDGLDAPPLRVLFALSFVLMSAATYLLASRDGMIWPVGLFIFIGICGGVMMSVIRDSTLNRPDRNLFPFEVAFYVAFAMPGVIAGLGMRWAGQRNRARERIRPRP
jgi:hypothetical protein